MEESDNSSYANYDRDDHSCVFFFQAEDGIRDLVRSRGLGDVYKRQHGILIRQTKLLLKEIEA